MAAYQLTSSVSSCIMAQVCSCLHVFCICLMLQTSDTSSPTAHGFLLTTFSILLQGKRKAEEYGEQSHGGSCDTSRHSDLMDDARYKKPKVPTLPI